MKIIDAHLHIFPSEPRTDAMAEKVGHVNSVEHLREVCGQLEIVHGVVMGNRSLDVGFHNYPTDLFHYCVGLDSLVLDEAAADNHRTRFVMCHFGNPFLQEAAAVLEKNPNVSTDLSGLLEGRVDLDAYFLDRAVYAELLRGWLSYVGCWDRVMFGTDWPIVNLEEYIRYIQRLVPRAHWQNVFFDNANQIYGLGLNA